MIKNIKYYKSDNILHGRKVKSFLTRICRNVYKEHNLYLNEHFKNYNWYDSPLFHKETSCSYLFVNAVKNHTRMLLPEASVQRKVTKDDTSNGLCDLWCEYKDISYFIEFKRGHYNVGHCSKDELQQSISNDFNTMIRQLVSIKGNSQSCNEYGKNHAFIGIMPFYCYCHKEQDMMYNHNDLLNAIDSKIDKRHNAEAILYVDEIPKKVQQTMKDDKDYDYVAKFVATVCVVITVQK